MIRGRLYILSLGCQPGDLLYSLTVSSSPLENSWSTLEAQLKNHLFRKLYLISPFGVSYPTRVPSQHPAKTINPKLLTLHCDTSVKHRSTGPHGSFLTK